MSLAGDCLLHNLSFVGQQAVTASEVMLPNSLSSHLKGSGMRKANRKLRTASTEDPTHDFVSHSGSERNHGLPREM